MRIGMGLIGDTSTGTDPTTGDTVICPPNTTFNPSNGNCDSSTGAAPITAAASCYNALTASYGPCVLTSSGTYGAASGVPWYAWAALGVVLLSFMTMGGRSR